MSSTPIPPFSEFYQSYLDLNKRAHAIRFGTLPVTQTSYTSEYVSSVPQAKDGKVLPSFEELDISFSRGESSMGLYPITYDYTPLKDLVDGPHREVREFEFLSPARAITKKQGRETVSNPHLHRKLCWEEWLTRNGRTRYFTSADLRMLVLEARLNGYNATIPIILKSLRTIRANEATRKKRGIFIPNLRK